MEKLFLLLSVSLLLVSCASVPVYYQSNAYIPKILNSNESKMKVITLKDGSFYDEINKVGVIVAADNFNGKRINYLLICPITCENVYDINHGVALDVKQTQDFISSISSAIENMNLEKINEDEFHVNFTVSPELSVKQIYNNYNSFKPILIFRYLRKKEGSYAEISINDVVYEHYKMVKFKQLLELGLVELNKGILK